MFRPQLLPHPGLFQIFAVDFSIDKNFNIWLNEIVPRPTLEVAGMKKLNKQYSEIVTSMTAIEVALMKDIDFDVIVEMSDFEVLYDERKTGEEKWGKEINPQCRI